MSTRRRQAILAVAVLVIAGSLVVSRLSRPFVAFGRLDQCGGGWAVVVFEGDEWRRSLPDHLRANAPAQMPVARWPAGLSFDPASGDVVDTRSQVVFRNGDRMRIEGVVVEVKGDPPPCYHPQGVMIDAVSGA